MAVPQTTQRQRHHQRHRHAGEPSGQSPEGSEPLSGPKRAAILMLALGEQYGGKVWSLLDDDEVRELSMRDVDARHRRGRRGRGPAARIRVADVGVRRADGNLRRHRAAAAAIPARRARHRHHGRNPRARRPQHVGEALQRPGRGARQLSQERISADHRRGAVEAEAGACRAGARDPARGHGARRGQPHAEDGGGAEGSDRARRTDAAHRIHVEPVADPPPRRPRGDGRNLQQFRPPDRNPLHHLAGRGQPRIRRAHQGADVHLRRPDQARLRLRPRR